MFIDFRGGGERDKEGEKRGRERQTDIDQLPPTGIATRDQARNLGMCPV